MPLPIGIAYLLVVAVVLIFGLMYANYRGRKTDAANVLAHSVDTSQQSIWTRIEAQAMGFSARWGRGLGWLGVGIIGALLIGYLEPLGVPAYTARWLGSLFKAATAAWGAYRISKDICSIDPSMAENPIERGMLHMARAFIVGGTIIAVLMAV